MHEPNPARGNLSDGNPTLKAIALPTKSKTLRVIRKVFPNARFQGATRTEENKKIKSVSLFYRPPGYREEIPVCNTDIPENGSEQGACFALLKSAFARLGSDASWDPKPPGRYVFASIEDYTGPEAAIPVELDPAVPIDEGKLGRALADRANAGADPEKLKAAQDAIENVVETALAAETSKCDMEGCSGYGPGQVCDSRCEPPSAEDLEYTAKVMEAAKNGGPHPIVLNGVCVGLEPREPNE